MMIIHSFSGNYQKVDLKNIWHKKYKFIKSIQKGPYVTFIPKASDDVIVTFSGELHVWNALKGETYVELKADDDPTCLVGIQLVLWLDLLAKINL